MSCHDKALPGWSREEPFAVVVQSRHDRQKGLYPEPVQTGKVTCLRAHDTVALPSKIQRVKSQEQAKRVQQLQAALGHKEQALAQAPAWWVRSRKAQTFGGRSRTHDQRLRRPTGVLWSAQTCAAGVPQNGARKLLGRSARTVQCGPEQGTVKADARQDARRMSANTLSAPSDYRGAVKRGQLSSLWASQIFPPLADQAIYSACESTFYRVLHQDSQHQHPGKASAANAVCSWDCTDLTSAIKGLFLHKKASLHQSMAGDPRALHSDNGLPIKRATRLATLHKQGVLPSFK